MPEISRVKIEGKKAFLHNGKAKPFEAPYDNDPIETNKALKQILIENLGCSEPIASQWCAHLADLLVEPSEYEEDQGGKKRCFIHKYSSNIPVIESIVVGGQPFFIQMKDVGKLDYNLSDEYELTDRILSPRSLHSYPGEYCKYVFESEEELRKYLKLASEKTPNGNFDLIFKLVKTIFKQYVVLDDHHITLLVADIIYSYFQDDFATTHYVICAGDNGSGKNSILLTFGWLGYRVFLATSVSGANLYTFQGSVEACQGTIAEDELDNLDEDRDKMNIWKSGQAEGTSKIPKTAIDSGKREQESYHSYCFKIGASEKSLDNLKAKGVLDRSFEIPCFVGRPKFNIKFVSHKRNEHLRKELEKTRKFLFACRMLYKGTRGC